MIGVSWEEHIREELLKAVSSIARPVFNIGSDRLVQLHQKVLRWGAQLLDDFVPLINVWSVKVKGTAMQMCVCRPHADPTHIQEDEQWWGQPSRRMKWWQDDRLMTAKGYDQCRGTARSPWPSQPLCSQLTTHPLEVGVEMMQGGRRACKQKVECTKKKRKKNRIDENATEEWWGVEMKLKSAQRETQMSEQGLLGGSTSSFKDTVPPWEEDFMSHHFR